jgi:hypothetical protein
MNQTDKNFLNDVKNKIEDIKTRLESYEKVDATLSNMTLLRTLAQLERADEVLEQGFVKDACEEIDCKL